MLSKAEFGGDYYWSTGEPSVSNIVQELEALGQFGDWFYKEHKFIKK